MKHFVIIGNGVAAAACIEGIRSVDDASPITVLSKEPHAVYCRPLISYYLQGKTDLERMAYRPSDFYEKNHCRVLYGTEATALDLAKGRVVSQEGSYPFDELCLATGSTPFVPPMEGLDNVAHAFSFMTLSDTLALEKALFPEARVLIVGAGLIGLKCAEGLSGRVGSITVCDLSDRVLSSILDDKTARAMQTHLEGHGIQFLLGESVRSFTDGEARMQSGQTVPFDLLVLAVGVRPSVGLAKDAGLTVGRGISVDTHAKTSAPHVYAAGDCSEGPDSSLGQARVLALLPNAYYQGFTAGVNMAGGDAVYDDAIPMNSIGFFGRHIMTAGLSPAQAAEGEVYELTDGESLRRFYIKDDFLQGFILLGDETHAGIYTSLIREKTPLHTLDTTHLFSAPDLSVFSPSVRAQKLGGEH